MELSDITLRSSVHINVQEILEYLVGKKVLVTGAGGSIGGEISRILIQANILSELCILGHGENSIYEILSKLYVIQGKETGRQTKIIPVIGEILDADFSKHVISFFQPDFIFHAAAYKHVPLMEQNPIMAIKNNFFATQQLLHTTIQCSESRFVFVSTDKVVQPESVYGASKLLAEELVLSEATQQKAEKGNAIMVVRFGNVFNSRGSVVSLFKKQIEQGGPLTLTDPRMKRYFMSIPEACKLVLKAGGVGQAGELYVLELGESISIKELAEDMIRHYGFEPHKDITIQIIGKRQGEKLEEHLLDANETKSRTNYDGVWSVNRSKERVPIQEIAERLYPLCYMQPDKKSFYFNVSELYTILSEYIVSLRNSAIHIHNNNLLLH